MTTCHLLSMLNQFCDNHPSLPSDERSSFFCEVPVSSSNQLADRHFCMPPFSTSYTNFLSDAHSRSPADAHDQYLFACHNQASGSIFFYQMDIRLHTVCRIRFSKIFGRLEGRRCYNQVLYPRMLPVFTASRPCSHAIANIMRFSHFRLCGTICFVYSGHLTDHVASDRELRCCIFFEESPSSEASFCACRHLFHRKLS